MKIPAEENALKEIERRLGALFELPPARRWQADLDGQADAVVELGPHVVVVEWKRSGTAAEVSIAAELARNHAVALGEGAIPLVAVPFMGHVGRDLCRKAGVAWLDLSGNALISVPGVRVWIEGRRNQFKRVGRPSSAFAPKSARIARWLLVNPGRWSTQREIAQATEMDEGFTSRIVAKLEDDELISRAPDGSIAVLNPDLLLDAWKEDYRFSKHQIVRGHVSARSSDSLLRLMAERLSSAEVRYAATGLAAAWLLTHFAAFRTVSLYLGELPSHSLMERLGVRPESRGANVWLISPNDDGVFHGSAEREGVSCVHPVQAYLDLTDHPERADEAAEHLRNALMNWHSNVQ